MATRIAKRRQQSVERRFNDSASTKKMVQAEMKAQADAKVVADPYIYGWESFPPTGLWEGNNTDLQAGQVSGPNNGQISSAKLYASNGN